MFQGLGSIVRIGLLLTVINRVRQYTRIWLQLFGLFVSFALIEHFYTDLVSYLTFVGNAQALLIVLLAKITIEILISCYALWLVYAQVFRIPNQQSKSVISGSKNVLDAVEPSPFVPRHQVKRVREKLASQQQTRQK